MAEPGGPPLRWPIAAALVGVLIVAVLLGGVMLARQLQASAAAVPVQPVAEPRALTPVAIATAQPVAPTREPATPRPPAAAATQPAAAAPTTPAAPTSAPPESAPRPASTPGATSEVAITIALDNGTPAVYASGGGPTPQPTPTDWWAQSNTVTPDLSAELTDAFQHFWQVRAQAMLDLNTAPLSEVMDGPLLQRELAGLDAMRAENQAEQIEVQHHMLITHATPTDATIVDNYTSRTIPVDLGSNELLTPSPVGTWHLAYHFEKLNGIWKVVEAVQLQYD